MSALREKLQRLDKGGAVPMGFGAAHQKESVPSLLLLALLAKKDAQLARRAAEAGADLLVTTGHEPAQAGLPWGVQMEEVGEARLVRLRTAGCDFLLFPPEKATAAVLADADLGKALVVDADMPEGYLRTVDGLGVDAVLLRPPLEALTVRWLMTYRRISQLATTPLLIGLLPSCAPSAAELEAVRDAGVKGLVAEVRESVDVDRLGALRGLIIGLTPRRRRVEGKRPTALLPTVAAKQEEPAPQREDDPEEDE